MTDRELRVGIVGGGFIARVHTNAWSTCARAFPLPLRPQLVALADRNRVVAEAAATRLGWASAEGNWQDLIARSDVDLVDICAPDDLHAAIAVAALEAGKHVLCEKPLASNVDEAIDMAAAAERASRRGVRAMVGFTYRRVPALELTRRLVLEGRFGQLTHLRASYLQDWLASPAAEMNWKLNRVSAPLGALSDLGSHVIDLAQFVAGHTVTRLVAVSSLGDRAPLTSEDQNRSRQHPAASEVQATDRMRAATRGSTQILAQLASGLIASFEVSRTAAGHWNDLRFELAGSEGSIRFRLERLNELELFDRRSPRGEDGFRTILMTDPHHPWLEGWWPPGHIIGWEHAFTHQVAALIEAIAQGQDPHPSFGEGLQIQQVIKAVVTSAETGAWVEVLA